MLFVLIIIGIVYCWYRRQKSNDEEEEVTLCPNPPKNNKSIKKYIKHNKPINKTGNRTIFIPKKMNSEDKKLTKFYLDRVSQLLKTQKEVPKNQAIKIKEQINSLTDKINVTRNKYDLDEFEPNW